jgi:hypothetical protein
MPYHLPFALAAVNRSRALKRTPNRAPFAWHESSRAQRSSRRTPFTTRLTGPARRRNHCCGATKSPSEKFFERTDVPTLNEGALVHRDPRVPSDVARSFFEELM